MIWSIFAICSLEGWANKQLLQRDPLKKKKSKNHITSLKTCAAVCELCPTKRDPCFLFFSVIFCYCSHPISLQHWRGFKFTTQVRIWRLPLFSPSLIPGTLPKGSLSCHLDPSPLLSHLRQAQPCMRCSQHATPSLPRVQVSCSDLPPPWGLHKGTSSGASLQDPRMTFTTKSDRQYLVSLSIHQLAHLQNEKNTICPMGDFLRPVTAPGSRSSPMCVSSLPLVPSWECPHLENEDSNQTTQKA